MKVYYNEIDPKSCAWLHALISEGLIPDGYVDERSILEVKPEDLEGYDQCHLFAGIAGWSKALQLAGWKGPVWTASCPCQPLSCAGLGKGHADERHLWPALYRLIAIRKPATIIGEQVASKDGREWFAGVRADLEGMGYAVGGSDLCSACVGAPNIRQRLYWVAESQSIKHNGRGDTRGGRGEFANGSHNGRLADAEHANQRPQYEHAENGCNGQDAGRQETHGESGTCGEVLGLAQPIGSGLEGHAGNVDDGHQPRRIEETTPRPTTKTGDAGGMENPNGVQRTELAWAGNGTIETNRPEKTGEHSGRGEIGGMGESNGAGLQPGIETPATMGHGSSTNAINFWTDSQWHYCRDGKYRRIPAQSCFQPMAPGLSDFVDHCGIEGIHEIITGFPLTPRIKGRTSMLKGYGNAINVELAAQFIRAYLDIKYFH